MKKVSFIAILFVVIIFAGCGGEDSNLTGNQNLNQPQTKTPSQPVIQTQTTNQPTINVISGQNQTAQAQTQNGQANQVSIQPTKNLPEKKSLLDWSKIQFDACGKIEKYEKLAWWKNFSARVEKNDYLSENSIDSDIKITNESEEAKKAGTVYNRQTYRDVYCKGEGKIYTICQNINKKLTTRNIKGDGEFGEGCLSKDGSGFIAVFPGQYMGEGNHIFRYDVKNDILEEAKKINEKQGDVWRNPPAVFGKRVNQIIKMTGSMGDAGCSAEADFDYDFLSNEIKKTKECSKCEGQKETCEIIK